MLIGCYDEWNLHCATVHGRPAPAVATRKKKVRCLICNEHFLSLSAHDSKVHEAQGQFNHPVQCPECIRHGEISSSSWIENRKAWMAHCASIHKDTSCGTGVQWQCKTRKIDQKSKKRSREGEDGDQTQENKRQEFE